MLFILLLLILLILVASNNPQAVYFMISVNGYDSRNISWKVETRTRVCLSLTLTMSQSWGIWAYTKLEFLSGGKYICLKNLHFLLSTFSCCNFNYVNQLKMLDSSHAERLFVRVRTSLHIVLFIFMAGMALFSVHLTSNKGSLVTSEYKIGTHYRSLRF